MCSVVLVIVLCDVIHVYFNVLVQYCVLAIVSSTLYSTQLQGNKCTRFTHEKLCVGLTRSLPVHAVFLAASMYLLPLYQRVVVPLIHDVVIPLQKPILLYGAIHIL